MGTKQRILTLNQRLMINILKENYTYIGKALPSKLYNIEYEITNSCNWNAEETVLENHFINTNIRSVRFLNGGDPRPLGNYTDEYFFVEPEKKDYLTLTDCIGDNCYCVYQTDKASYACSVLDSQSKALATKDNGYSVCDEFRYCLRTRLKDAQWEFQTMFDDKVLEEDFINVYNKGNYLNNYVWILDKR